MVLCIEKKIKKISQSRKISKKITLESYLNLMFCKNAKGTELSNISQMETKLYGVLSSCSNLLHLSHYYFDCEQT